MKTITYFILLIIVICVFSCQSNKIVRLNINEVKSNFVYQEEIKCFNKDSINNFLPLVAGNKAKAILNDLHLSIFQNPEQIDTIVTEHTYYFYNIQNSKKMSVITVFKINDDWINQIIMLSYDKNGFLQNETILAELGGNQDFFIEREGCFINDSTYRMVINEFEYNIKSNENELKNTKTQSIILKGR